MTKRELSYTTDPDTLPLPKKQPVAKKGVGRPKNPVKAAKASKNGAKKRKDTEVMTRIIKDDGFVPADADDTEEDTTEDAQPAQATTPDERVQEPPALMDDENEHDYLEGAIAPMDEQQGADPRFLFSEQMLSMKTEVTEELSVVAQQAYHIAADWDVPELRKFADGILGLRVSLNRKGRGEGVEMMKAEMARQQFMMEQPNMPPTMQPMNTQTNGQPARKTWRDRIRG